MILGSYVGSNSQHANSDFARTIITPKSTNNHKTVLNLQQTPTPIKEKHVK